MANVRVRDAAAVGYCWLLLGIVGAEGEHGEGDDEGAGCDGGVSGDGHDSRALITITETHNLRSAQLTFDAHCNDATLDLINWPAICIVRLTQSDATKSIVSSTLYRRRPTLSVSISRSMSCVSHETRL